MKRDQRRRRPERASTDEPLEPLWELPDPTADRTAGTGEVGAIERMPEADRHIHSVGMAEIEADRRAERRLFLQALLALLVVAAMVAAALAAMP